MDQANVVFDIGKTADQHRKIESMDGNNCYAILMLSKNFNLIILINKHKHFQINLTLHIVTKINRFNIKCSVKHAYQDSTIL